MKSKKDIISFIVGFCCSTALTLLIICSILKFSIFDHNYIKSYIKNNNYYQLLNNDIRNEVSDYILSTGLNESVVDNIFTISDLQEDTEAFIDGFYSNNLSSLKTFDFKESLRNNINTYIKDNNLKVTSDSDIQSFINDIDKLYKDKVHLYDSINSYVKKFSRINSILNTMLIAMAITFIISLSVVIILKFQYKLSIFLASGLMLLFIKYLVTAKFDYNNILIISVNFSHLMKGIINGIMNSVLFAAFSLIAFSLIVYLILIIIDKKKIKGE